MICQQLLLSIETTTCQEQRVSYLWQQAGLWPLHSTCHCRGCLRIAGELHTVSQPPQHLPLLVKLWSPAVKASEVDGSCPSDHVEQESLSPDSKGAQNALKLTQHHHSCKHLSNGPSPYGAGRGRGWGHKDEAFLALQKWGYYPHARMQQRHGGTCLGLTSPAWGSLNFVTRAFIEQRIRRK